jgi:hydroxymethylpyrimidine kinase/phosphomethylpyrimidine kinase/thiamine-phosphate diphosphorylase
MLTPIVWSIAGSDNSGGAGIQADNLTFQDFFVHGCNIVTAITAQNSQQVSLIHCVDESIFEMQWQTLQEEYAPFAIKLGMLGNESLIRKLLEKLTSIDVPVICDPVLKASAGQNLIQNIESYLPLLACVDVLTPNQQEFSALFDYKITTAEALEEKALAISKAFKLQLMITGGENRFNDNFASDLCVVDGRAFWLHSPLSNSKNTHGTGCVLSSAIAAALAKGYNMLDAFVLAKAYINQGFSQQQLFKKTGPVLHAGFPDDIQYLPYVSSSSIPVNVKFTRVDTLRLGAYPVVDSLLWLERCLKEGVKTLQLRVKNISDVELEAIIVKAVALGMQYEARLFINDYWQLAIKHKAYGVHLGQEDIETADMKAIADAGLYLGLSTHSWYEIARAHSFTPSYIAIGPVYATTTKVMPFAPQGLDQLKEWVEMIGDAYPVVAIGGIDLIRAQAVAATGVGSVAMVRAVTEAADYRQVLKAFANIMSV